MDSVCRTCIKSLPKAACVSIFKNVEANKMSLKDMLEILMPEMDLEVSEGETVICVQCTEFIKNAYIFRKTCLRTEEKVYDYFNANNLKLGEKINLLYLVDQLDSRIENCPEIKADFPPHNVKSTQTDSTPNNPTCDTQEPLITLSDSDSDTKISKPRKTRKRKGAINQKEGKPHDYSSLKRSYTCDLCEYKAYRRDLLNTHKLKHDRKLVEAKEYKCDFCSYTSKRKRSLDRHLFTHRGKSKHTCDFCTKSFAEKYQLKLHAMTHTGEELPHRCEECNAGFLTRSHWRQHMTVRHLGGCSSCSQEKCEHRASGHHKCNICEASFSDRRGLDAHKFTHTGGELPFRCDHCDFSTAWKGNLRKHMRNKHENLNCQRSD